jgi:hypothetical protein
VLSNIRCQFLYCTEVLSASCYDQLLGINFMQLSPSAKFKFLVGDIGYASNNYIGTFYDHYSKYKFQNVLMQEKFYYIIKYMFVI